MLVHLRLQVMQKHWLVIGWVSVKWPLLSWPDCDESQHQRFESLTERGREFSMGGPKG